MDDDDKNMANQDSKVKHDELKILVVMKTEQEGKMFKIGTLHKANDWKNIARNGWPEVKKCEREERPMIFLD